MRGGSDSSGPDGVRAPSGADSSDRATTRADRLEMLKKIGRHHGFFRPVGKMHDALFVDEGERLLVTFDLRARVLEKNLDGLPLGFDLVRNGDWSCLSILGERDSWFRDKALFRLFDYLIDDGFFDRFELVVFAGMGPVCGYGALAYSVAAPGAHTLALNPVASLAPDAAPFESRFSTAQSLDFRGRYGYAPQMIEAAASVSLLIDGSNPLHLAHAELFQGTHVRRHDLRWGAFSAAAILTSGDTWPALIEAAANGPIDAAQLEAILRPAQGSLLDHIGQVMRAAEESGQPDLALQAARQGQRIAPDGRFDAVIERLRRQQKEG